MEVPLGRLAATAAMFLLVTAIPACSVKEKADAPDTAVHSSGNLVVFTTADDFSKGSHEGTEAVQFNNGALTLKAGAARGVYTSPEVETKPFEYMVLSWNADTPAGSHIEIEGRVRAVIQGKRQWSGWLSWGAWSTAAFRGDDGKTALPGSAPTARAEDGIAKIDTDELFVKGSSGETADRFQYRLTLHRPAGTDAAPKVLLVACTIRNTLAGQAIPVEVAQDVPDLSRLEKDLDVPTYSQTTRQASISGSICSPTSVAMALAYHGVDVSPEEAAWGVRDYGGNMFGNWPFNTAYAAANGFTAYVRYGTPPEGGDPWCAVKNEIAGGNPAIVSVKYRKPGYSSSEPVVEGVPINSTGGHLVVVRGFTWQDGTEYVIVNDPAARKIDEVRRLYRADQFFRAWTKQVMYVMRPDDAEIAEACLQAPIPGTLVPVGGVEGGVQKYELRVDDSPVDLSANTIRSIVVSFNGEKTTPVNPRVAALSQSNLLWFSAGSKPGRYTFWLMGMNKDTYKAEITWK